MVQTLGQPSHPGCLQQLGVPWVGCQEKSGQKMPNASPNPSPKSLLLGGGLPDMLLPASRRGKRRKEELHNVFVPLTNSPCQLEQAARKSQLSGGVSRALPSEIIVSAPWEQWGQEGAAPKTQGATRRFLWDGECSRRQGEFPPAA